MEITIRMENTILECTFSREGIGHHRKTSGLTLVLRAGVGRTRPASALVNSLVGAQPDLLLGDTHGCFHAATSEPRSCVGDRVVQKG